MGHIRLGRLPKRHRWREVVGLLETSPGNAAEVARLSLQASERYLRDLREDPSLNHCFWLLTRITWAARSDSFVERLADIGIKVDDTTPTIAFIALVADHARDQLSRHPESGPTSELASLAMRRALTETAGQQGRSLFDSTVDDLQAALRMYSTKERFGELAQRFFGDLLARTLRSCVDREIPNLVGESPGMQRVADSRDAIEALDRHARESAAILREFSGGWYSKHNWKSGGEISAYEARGYVSYALGKLRSELGREVSR